MGVNISHFKLTSLIRFIEIFNIYYGFGKFKLNFSSAFAIKVCFYSGLKHFLL